jgi:hypothetical protein
MYRRAHCGEYFGAGILIPAGVVIDGGEAGGSIEPVTDICTVAGLPNRFPSVINAGVVVTVTA